MPLINDLCKEYTVLYVTEFGGKKRRRCFLGSIVLGSNIWHLTQGVSQVNKPVSGTLQQSLPWHCCSDTGSLAGVCMYAHIQTHSKHTHTQS